MLNERQVEVYLFTGYVVSFFGGLEAHYVFRGPVFWYSKVIMRILYMQKVQYLLCPWSTPVHAARPFS